eukprot:TRINITY_DN73434_c0_g1_i1.p1 TRINITY_DN73434_c0_g1~~TRINITY_DN73434_c0_g1_i1.p1  ORF type:complete len:157 (+),score=24.59 TRINITY_DN73434_c0_g1_i1:1-471(+)
MSHRTHDPTLQCGWYFVTFCVDTILGTYLTYRGLRASERLLMRLGCYDTACTGHYPTKSAWLKQTLLFVTLVGAARLACGCLIALASTWLKRCVAAICSVFSGHPSLLLAFVMLLGPGCLNTAQYYVQDNFLKKSAPDSKRSDTPAHETGCVDEVL